MDNNKGQSTIEFIMSFVFIFGFIFSFLKLALTYTDGYLVHYATFMASRAYMVYENNSNQPGGGDGPAEKKALEVFDKFKLPLLIKGHNGHLKFNDPDSQADPTTSLYVGAYSSYSDFIILPTLGGRKNLQLRSESFLGREPTRSECFFQVCSGLGEAAGQGQYCDIHSTVADNGC